MAKSILRKTPGRTRASAQSTAKPQPMLGGLEALRDANEHRRGTALAVNQICTLYNPDDSDHGERCQVVEGYDPVHRVGEENGAYMENGKRYSYRPGYTVTLKGIPYFMPAWMLVALNADAEYSHLRLVHDSARVKS